jgi:hypothetical protein
LRDRIDEDEAGIFIDAAHPTHIRIHDHITFSRRGGGLKVLLQRVEWNEPLPLLIDSTGAKMGNIRISGVSGEAERPFAGVAQAGAVWTPEILMLPYKRRRCVIPASGYYKSTGPKQAKQPHLFTAVDGSPILALAGLWDRWKNPETQDDVQSCTIITGPASEWTSTYHTRMPAILAPDRIEPWLDGSLDAEGLFPITNEALRAWPVSTRLNRTGVGDDDPSMILPISAIG